MANRRIKAEAANEPSLFVEQDLRPPPPASWKHRVSKVNPKHGAPPSSHQSSGSVPKWKWKQSSGKTFQQCLVMEKAAESGLQLLQHMKATLKAHNDPNGPSLTTICQLWTDRIVDILREKKSSLIYIGFIGATGAGKTSLLNSLLQMKLLPVSTIQACTATVVEVSYNHSDDKDALYHCDVEFVSREDWRKQLELVFADIKAHYSKDGKGDGEQDKDRYERINDALATLKFVYRHLKSIGDLRASSVEELMKHDSVGHVLGSIKTIKSGNLSIFTTAIRPYIATSEGDKSKIEFWPFIKCVRLLVKVEFLRSGLVLVDLPGNMDRSSARGAVAANYQKKLTVPLIVANATRGIDDQSAHSVLEDIMKTDLKMDGLYQGGNLCFILSQFDTPYDVTEYWKQNNSLRNSLKDEFAKARELLQKLEDRKTKRAASRSARGEYKRSIEIIEAEIEKIESEQPRKRRRGVTASISYSDDALTLLRIKIRDLKDKADEEADSIENMENSIASLTKALQFNKSLIYQACNNDRKAKATAAVKQDFENNLLEMGLKTDKNLQVFCTSSMVFLDYVTVDSARQSGKTLGFPDQQSTEIPKLRDWLVEFTAPGRISKAKATLDDIERLLTSMKPWVDDRSADVKLSAYERSQREPVFEQGVDELTKENSADSLQQELCQLSIHTTEILRDMAETGVFKKLPVVESRAAKSCAKTVRIWAEGGDRKKALAWNTHRAVNQRCGDWTSEQGRASYAHHVTNHMWNDDLAKVYKDELLIAWGRVFYEVFPEELAAYAQKQKSVIIDFAVATANSDSFPGYTMALEILKEQLLKTGNLAIIKSEALSSSIDSHLRAAHRLTCGAIRKKLEPMYAHCAAQRGHGHFHRNKEYQLAYMETDGRQMYKEVSNIIRQSLQKLLSGLPTKLDNHRKEILLEVRKEIAIFFEQNSTTASRASDRKNTSNVKIKLQNALGNSISQLNEAWNQNVEFQADEPFDLSTLDFRTDGRLNLDAFPGDPKDDEFSPDD